MKKLLLTLTLITLSLTVLPQVYLVPEDFSGEIFPPEGWTIENGGDENTFEQGPMPVTTEPPCTWIQTSSNMEIDDRIITPAITLPEGSEAKFYAQLRGSVGWALAMYWDPENLVRYYVEISTDGGLNWTILLDMDNQQDVLAAGATWPWPDWTWFDIQLDLTAYAGETINMAFHHEKEFVPTGGGSYGITNMGIWEDTQDDIELISMQMENYSLVNNPVSITGTLKNLGNNLVTSIEGEYLINGETTEEFTISGLNIGTFESYTFAAGEPTTFTNVDIFDVELVITKVNGVEDSSPDNNFQTHLISTASELVDRKPLFEVFTSSTCGPCASGNATLDAVLDNNPGTYSLVKNQVDWPGSGDPYYNEDCGIRVDYYGVGGVPTMITNGFDSYYPGSFTQGNFNSALAEEAYIDLDLNYIFDGLSVDASVTIDPNINIEDASVHFAVVEKTTYNNVGSNGETEFHNVMMKMLPDGNGTALAIAAGTPLSFQESANLIATFIEEFDDLMIVVWVQDNLTHSVLQSETMELDINVGVGKQPEVLGLASPNPSKGSFTIYGCSNSTVEISNMAGKMVYSQFTPQENLTIDLTLLNKGIYILKVTDSNQTVRIEKLIIR